MDFGRCNRSSYSYLTFFILISTACGYRNYKATLEGIKCIPNPKNNFFKTVSCKIDKGVLSAYVELQKQVDDLRLDITGSMLRNNMDTKELFNFKELKACDILNENVFNPILKITRNMIEKYVKFPEKCPIPLNFVFKLSNYTMDSEHLPAYLPDSKFKICTNVNNGRMHIMTLEVVGRVSQKRVQSKGRKTSNKS